jgi:proline dehydrogenase
MSLLDRAVSLALPVVPRPIVGYFSRRYIAGTTVEDAFRVARALQARGAMATLDILGEFITRPEEAAANTRAYLDLLHAIARAGLSQVNVSVKLTALGLLLRPSPCLDNVRSLVSAAHELGNFVRIDMEDAQCTSRTIDLYRTLRAEFPGDVGLVLQARLRRTLADVLELTREPANFRLCKGIYVEPRAIAHTDREIIRRNFTRVLEAMLDRGAYVGIATHDELLVWEAIDLLTRRGLSRDRYEFQMLLGVDEPLRDLLLAEGHRLRVYVPFGEQWYAYSIRRLRENPQIAGYAFKAILKKA